VQNVLSYGLISKHLRIKIYRKIILLVVLYGCETWSLTLREERMLRVFENRVLRKLFGPKRDEVRGEWRKLHNGELNYLYSSRNIFLVSESRRMGWAGNVAWMGRGEVYTGIWWGNLREKGHLQDPGLDGTILLRWILRKRNMGAWTGSSWLWIGTGGGHLNVVMNLRFSLNAGNFLTS